MTCDDALLALVLGHDDAAIRAHVDGCPACAADRAVARDVGGALAAYAVAAPEPRHVDAVVRAAAPLLAANAARARRRRATLARAIAASLAPLPLLVLLNVEVLRAVHGWLAAWIPPALGTYLVGTWAAFVVVLFTFTYAAVPLLAGHQARHALEEAHA